MRYGKMVAGGVLVAAAGILFFVGQADTAIGVGTIGVGMLGVGAAHKLDKLLEILKSVK